jgi:carbonic anhydrase
VFDVNTGSFVPASRAEHSGTGPYKPSEDSAVFDEIDTALCIGVRSG